MDVTADGCVLVSADHRGLVVATDLTTKTPLWSKEMNQWVCTVHIHNNVVFVPAYSQHVHVLDVMTGDVLRRYPVLSGGTAGLVVIPGELPLYSSPCTRVSPLHDSPSAQGGHARDRARHRRWYDYCME